MADGSNGRAYEPPAHQREVDSLFAAAKREAGAGKVSIFKPAPPRPKLSESVVDQRLAEELLTLSRRIERLGEALATDPLLVHRHGAALQGLDLTNQILRHLSTVIETEDREAAIDRISLQELKARLQRRPLKTIGFS